MALINVECSDESCGRIEAVYRAVADWPKTPTCTKCGAGTAQIHLPSHVHATTVDPVVVYQAPDGTFRFPPATESASTAMYDGKGFTRIELRGWADVRRFESHMNQQEISLARRKVEHQQEQFERGEKERRSEIRRGMEQGFQVPEYDERGKPTGRTQTVRLSEYSRAIMQAAIARNDAKGGPKVKEPGFHSEVYSVDRSNRAPDPRRRGQ